MSLSYLLSTAIIVLHHTESQEPAAFQLAANENGVNEMLDFLAADIDNLVIGTKIPSMETSEIETSSSEIDSFQWEELYVTFNESTQMISLTMKNISGTIATMDVTAKYTLFVTLTCNGEATPEFWNWNFKFNAKLNASSDDSCNMQLIADEDSVDVESDELDLHEDWTSSSCDSVIDAVDAVMNINDFVIDEIVDFLPSMIVGLLTEDFIDVLIPTERIIGSDQTLGVEEYATICYHNSTIIGDTLAMAMSMQFSNDTFSEMDNEGMKFSSSQMALEDTNLSEIGIFVVFGFIGSLVGCAFNYWILRRLGKTDKIWGDTNTKDPVSSELVEYNKTEGQTETVR